MPKQMISKQQYNQFLKSQKNADKIHNQVSQIFDRHLEPMDLWTDEESTNVLEPRIEIAENEKNVNITAEIPGLSAADIDVEISSDGFMTISGEKKEEHEDKGKGYYFSERSYGSVQRTILLPNDLDINKAVAECDKGILKVDIPKSPLAATKMRKVSVKGK